eukprot:2043340-Alexandrium_andersonii.AAC.1
MAARTGSCSALSPAAEPGASAPYSWEGLGGGDGGAPDVAGHPVGAGVAVETSAEAGRGAPEA